ncbi:hypothetical protein L917_17897 [Phytophthora nicotianae]|uniref:Uncharacterized protein n=1 Tax=Phytophthora nicotianae TaxID=4792 RepID=W2K9E3_PHYNI|nr:hypothetical protein L917_17897 [Phytophthora nicotianae]
MGRTTDTKDIPKATRESIALVLAKLSRNGRLKRGAGVAAAAKLGCCRQRALILFKEKT